MPSKKDRMKARGRQHGARDLDALLNEAAEWEAGQIPTAPAGVEPELVPIDLVGPDAIQPRRAMPELLRARWIEGAPIEGVLEQWSHDALEDLAQFDYAPDWRDWFTDGASIQYLEEGEMAIQDANLRPETFLWLLVLRLAANIYQHGLQVPITIYPDGDGYRLQAGERRLLAFHLITWLEFDDFTHIPAVIREAYDPFGQAAENGARRNLTAIEIARQLALLLKAAYDMPLPHDEQPGQSWYADAADLRIPHGQADQFAEMLGFESPRVVRRYRDLLGLPAQVWNWADQFGWTEGKLRNMIKQAHGNSDQLVRIAQQEVTRTLGGKVEKPTLTPTEKALRAARSGLTAMRRVVNMPDDELDVMPKQERDRLVETAREVLKRLG